MATSFITLLFTATGSFVLWCAKGFKGSFDKEMVSRSERHTYKGRLRIVLGVAVWAVVLFTVSSILSSHEESGETKAYKARVNEKGKIQLEEIK